MKNNKYEIDMCNGTIMDKLISFAFPLMLSGILQLMFNAVDIIVVGRFSGSQALAAVGSTTALTWSECACGKILCRRTGGRNVTDRTYCDHVSTDQRCCDGICWCIVCEGGIGTDGHTG